MLLIQCFANIYFTEQSNELLIGWYNGHQMRIYISNSYEDSDWYSQDQWDYWWLGWAKHCFTWRIDGMFKVLI